MSRRADACPGALQVHQAADGGVARIRVPGGQMRAEQLRAVVDAAAELGDGSVELTSRANLQIRGLPVGAETRLGVRLAEAGLLPSQTHERVRNIVASPLTGRDGAGCTDVRDLVRELDAALCAAPVYARLPGRFLFTVDDGRGDVAWLDADVSALFVSAEVAAILVGGQDVRLRAGRDTVVAAMLACAEAFLSLRADEWRIAELVDGPRRIAERAGDLVSGPELVSQPPCRHAPLGWIDQADGRVAIGAAAPLGWLDQAQGAVLASAGSELVVTPWRGVVLPDLPSNRFDLIDRLLGAGLLLRPDDPGVGVSACVGRPGCAKALADVRTDAATLLTRGIGSTLPVHWSGCARRCGRPRGRVVDLIATGDGYLVGGDDRVLPAGDAAEAATRIRREYL